METPQPRFRGLLSTGDGIALVGIFLTIGLAIWQTFSSQAETELRQKQNSVEIAVRILSARAHRDKEGNVREFEADQQSLRRWAVQTLNDNSEQKIPSEAVELIATGRAVFPEYGTDWGYTDYGTTWDYADSPTNSSVAPSPPANVPPAER
ncbi:MAG: hypothetical protein MUF31_15945 [Akkermansiaceae bacterium]|jgi:hypothetical protein|nr:hypothetical protein [Akkermansiaceae bacterium]